FKNEDEDIDQRSTIEMGNLKGKKAVEALLGKKVGDTIELNTKGLFKEDQQLSAALGIARDKAEKLNITVAFTLEEINEREPAALDQELFDKLFGKDVVTSEKALKEKIKEDSENQFGQQSDQKLLNDITEKLIEETKFELPAEFLKRWIQISGEEPLSEDEAKEEYERSEKGLRYQLIEGKLIQDHGLQVQFEELKEFAKGFIRSQMAQYGHLDPKEEELDGIAARVLGNQDEVKRLSEQLMSQKLLDLYKEKANLKVKEVSFDDFIKEAYS